MVQGNIRSFHMYLQMPRLDMVIFGATGFTGKRTVIEMIDFAKKYQIGLWGIAGRSEERLNALVKEVATITGADLSNVKIIIAEVGDDKSLENMCAQTKVLINCSGPYREYGEPVVKAAIRAKTDYVDISAEINFNEKIQLLYNRAARKAGVYIINSCGFDSVLVDMGVVFLQKNFSGTINSVRSYLSLYVPPEIMAKSERPGIIGHGTWTAFVFDLANFDQLIPLRQKLYPTSLPQMKPELIQQILHQKEGSEDYYIPFIEFDESVVRRTQRFRYDQQGQRPIQFYEYYKTGTFSQSLAFLTTISYIYLMSQSESNRKALLQYPEQYTDNFISLKGPTDIVMNNTFFTFELIAEGWDDGTDIENSNPNKKVVAKVCSSS